MNPNCILAAIYIFTYPIILTLSFLNRHSYIVDTYLFIDKLLHYKPYLYMLLIAELSIWIHNIIIGI